ncbi:MAG: signal peptidase II [Candidatus Eisenbacteria bacterium]|nr:signal peptidase II [Candidatus Eisenbacteria bacterium]
MKRFLLSAAVVLLGDQVTKHMARVSLEPGVVVPVIGDLLRFRYVHNAGAAFGFFQGSRFLFIGISLVSIAVIIYLILSKRYAFRGSRVAFGMVFGGAVGNLIDRIWLSEVIDFIDVGVGSQRWPTFNIADAGVTIGVVYLVFSVLMLGRSSESSDPAEGGAGDAQPEGR